MLTIESFYHSIAAFQKNPDHPYASAGLEDASLEEMTEAFSTVPPRTARTEIELLDSTCLKFSRFNEADTLLGYDIVIGSAEDIAAFKTVLDNQIRTESIETDCLTEVR